VSPAVSVRAPATSANLGPGFDCAGAALDLWNELEVTEGDGVQVDGEGADEITPGPDHLGLRAFRLLAPTDGLRFRFVNRIPLARGLGSSAATIALGLVAAVALRGGEPDPEELLAAGLELESHADNLAPALAGGVCLSWLAPDGRQRLRRVADTLPLVPVAVVPDARVSTQAARAALPAAVAHADAAYSSGRAVMLGAALASGDAALLAAAFDDRLHEPYRGPLSPVFAPLRNDLPPGAVAATISGSGPTVIVWTQPAAAASCEQALAGRFPDARVWRLAVCADGARALAP
jgi:homoserine kinase